MYIATMTMATITMEAIDGKVAAVSDTETHSEVRQNAGYLIWRLSMRWRAAMDSKLAPYGLTQAQYSVLAPLYSMTRGGARPSQRELADLTGLDAIYVSKLVRALEREGFVARAVSTADPRAVELTLTEHGAATIRDAVGTVYDLRDELTSALGGNEGVRTAELVGLLRELLDTPLRTMALAARRSAAAGLCSSRAVTAG
jgi:MarR family transcriptional regulator, organic hydroperoxide resistance regulator